MLSRSHASPRRPCRPVADANFSTRKPVTLTVIEFWYEFASTYSYPAAMRIEHVAQAEGVTVAWKPFLLGPIFTEAGWSTSPFVLQPVKGAYMWRDLERICDRLGLPFSRPEPFPQNGLTAARIALALPDDGRRATFSRAVYRAAFAEDCVISDRDMLRGLLSANGFDPDAWLAKADQPTIKQALREQTALAKSYRIFGAPSLRTPDGELFWGNDRLEEALAWASTHSSGQPRNP